MTAPPSLWWLAESLTLKTIANDSFMPLCTFGFAKWLSIMKSDCGSLNIGISKMRPGGGGMGVQSIQLFADDLATKYL